MFISARYRRMHFVNLGFSRFTSKFFLRKTVCGHVATESVWDILKLLSAKLLRDRTENCHKVEP